MYLSKKMLLDIEFNDGLLLMTISTQGIHESVQRGTKSKEISPENVILEFCFVTLIII